MEPIRNCEHCAFYVETKSPISDGFCYARKSNPQPVRKWFTKCKFWSERSEDDTQSRSQ